MVKSSSVPLDAAPLPAHRMATRAKNSTTRPGLPDVAGWNPDDPERIPLPPAQRRLEAAAAKKAEQAETARKVAIRDAAVLKAAGIEDRKQLEDRAADDARRNPKRPQPKPRPRNAKTRVTATDGNAVGAVPNAKPNLRATPGRPSAGAADSAARGSTSIGHNAGGDKAPRPDMDVDLASAEQQPEVDPTEAVVDACMGLEAGDEQMDDLPNVPADGDMDNMPADEGMSEPESLEVEVESDDSPSEFALDEDEEEQSDTDQSGEDEDVAVVVQPANKKNKRPAKIRRTDITAVRSDVGLPQKRKSVTSSSSVEHADSGQFNKKSKAAATPTGLRAGWDTLTTPVVTPKGKSSAPPVSTLRQPVATASAPRTATTRKTSFAPATSAQSKSAGPVYPRSVNSAPKLVPTARVNTADHAVADSSGLNEYGGFQDEDDAAEAAANGHTSATAWNLPTLDSPPSGSSDFEDAFPVDKLTEVVHVPTGIVQVNHRPSGNMAARGHRWTNADLAADIRPRFTHELIPLTRVTMSALLPWQSLSMEERQALFDRVFPTHAHVIEDNDVVYTLMNNRITEWQGKFAAAALTVLEAHFIKAGMAEPEVRATWCREQLGHNVAAMKAPFLWHTWHDGKKKGCFQGELLLKTFGIVHIPVMKALPMGLRQGDGATDLRPCGALILAALALERALNVWLTGSRVVPGGHPGYFSADNWGDKTVITRGVAKSSAKVANMFARAQKLSCERWVVIMEAAREHHRIHKAVQEREAITIESASDAPMTESDEDWEK